MTWRSSLFPSDNVELTYTETVITKYYARGIVINRGLGLYAGIGGECYDCYPDVVRIVQNLNTVLAGAQPANGSPMQIGSEAAASIHAYWFSLSSGDYLVALWTNGIAVDNDPGTPTILTFPGFSAQRVTGTDILYGIEQKMVTEDENGNLVIRGLLVRDYPLILRITP